jgi:hypothetical protein
MPLARGGQSASSGTLAHLFILGIVSNRNRVLVTLAVVLAVVLLVAVGFFLARPQETPDAVGTPGTIATPTASGTVAEQPPSTAPTTSAASYECTTATEGFEPVRFTIEGSLEVDEAVLALGEDENGNIAAPPPAEKRTASWWMNGPEPGPTAGKAILSVHTYRNGGALGNEMYEGGQSQLRPGDLIKLYAEDGEVACYEFTEAKKVWVDEYDPDSDVMVDLEGDPELGIIICWDFDPSADEDAGEDPWKSRVFFYGSLV